MLFFPAIALAFVSSAFAPVAYLAGWMQPVARVNPVTAAAAVIRSLAGGERLAPRAPLLELGCWTAALILIPGPWPPAAGTPPADYYLLSVYTKCIFPNASVQLTLGLRLTLRTGREALGRPVQEEAP